MLRMQSKLFGWQAIPMATEIARWAAMSVA